MEKVVAAVRVGPSKTELREFPMPDIPEDSALLKMEVAGICGTDVKMYSTPPSNVPVIMGHENIGVIAKAGREFTRRKGFKEGDLIFLEHYVMCGMCEWCHTGQYRHCENTDWLYIGRESAAFVGWIRGIRVPSMECRPTSRAEERYAGAGRTSHPYGERRRMVALRR